MSGAAHAGVLFSDNFDGENGGASQLSYGQFKNWDVSSRVDLIKSGDFGVTCAGASGSCVDLFAHTGSVEILTKKIFGFAVGDHVTLSFEISGNQRDSTLFDDFGTFMFFPGSANIKDFSSSGAACGSQLIFPGVINTTEIVSGHPTSSFDQPFLNCSFSFTAQSAGAIQIGFSSRSAEGPIRDVNSIGPVLDNVKLSVDGVPEPLTWSLMIVGFGLVGVTLRAGKSAPDARQTC